MVPQEQKKCNKIVATIMSVYFNDKLEFIEQAIKSISNPLTDIYLVIDGNVPIDVNNFLKECYHKGIIKYLHVNSDNLGLAASLNILINVVIGVGYEYIARMDADDISCELRYEKQIDFLNKNLNIDIVGGYIIEFGSSNGVIKYPLDNLEMKKYFGKRNPVGHVTVMFRSRFFNKAGLYPTHTLRNEDTHLWINGFLGNAIFANIPEILVSVRVTNQFVARRSSINKIWKDTKSKFQVIYLLNLSKLNYIYPLLYFIYMLFPYWIKNKLSSLIRYSK